MAHGFENNPDLLPEYITGVISQDKRDFTRPRESLYISNAPMEDDILTNEIGSIVNWVSGEETDINNTADQKNIEDKSTQESEKETGNEILMKLVQQSLSRSLPVVGKLYSGPIDGKYNSQVGTALQTIESIIAQKVQELTPNKGVNYSSQIVGRIWNPTSKMPATNMIDIISALSLIYIKMNEKKQ